MEINLPTFNDWQVNRLIGSGATARVYEARSKVNDKIVALKVVPLSGLADDPTRARVKREILALQTLRHPGIVRLLSYQENQESLILELEIVEGSTLTEWLEENSSPLLEPKIFILAKLAEALAIAHDSGIIHRDLKPDNVLVSKAGEIKLTDFGLAKQTRFDSFTTLPGSLLGSLAYMSPEVLTDQGTSAASDIFSFGVIAYEVCTGEHPFPHDDAKSLFEAWSNESAFEKLKYPSTLAAPVAALLRKCLDRNPSSRPKSLWSAYASLISMLHDSGIADECQAIVSTLPENAEATSKAFETKHAMLEASIEELLKAEHRNQPLLLAKLNEFSLLFPDSKKTIEYLAALNPESRSNKKLLLLALLIPLLGVTAYQVTRHETPAVQSAAPHVQTEENAPALISATEESLPQKAISSHPRKVSASPAEATTGTLRLKTDADVRVFVDGRRMGNSQLANLSLSEGTHILLLERDGYLPIEKKITIKPGAVTRIYANENPEE